MKKRTALIAASIAGLTLLGGLAGFAVKALADGIPSPNPLYYSGTLTEGGALVNDARTIGVNLYADGTSTMPLCQTIAADTKVTNGRFRVQLNDACKAQVNQNPNAYIEVLDGTVNLGRSKIGAVPYAVEADHAVNATNAANATGALDQRLAGLESGDRIVSASISAAGTVVRQTGTWMTVTHPGAGDYPVTIAGGTFSSTPTCLVTAISGNQVPPTVRCYGVSNTAIHCTSTTTDGLTGVDSGLSLVCMGAK